MIFEQVNDFFELPQEAVKLSNKGRCINKSRIGAEGLLLV